jgi:hypothetical protein
MSDDLEANEYHRFMTERDARIVERARMIIRLLEDLSFIVPPSHEQAFIELIANQQAIIEEIQK